MRSGVLLAAALVFGSAPASGLTPVAQDRHVFAIHRAFTTAGNFTDSETLSAPDYGPFAASVNGGTAFPFATWPELAVQDSSIEPGPLHASGSSLANPSGGVEVLHEIDSESIYSVDFVLDAQHAFTLTGQIDLAILNSAYPSPDSAGCHRSSARITLSGPSGVVAEITHFLPPVEFPPLTCFEHCEASLPLAASGVLEPGGYRFEARSDSSGEGIFAPHRKCSGRSSGSYSADLVLAPTVPALPLPLAPLLGVALLGAARAVRRRVRR